MTSTRVDDGHSTVYTFGAKSTVKFYEKTVTPPGLDGGGEIDTTTMHNVLYRTKSPKKLITMTEAGAEVAYDVAVYSDILSLLNVNNLITVHFPDGSKLAFYGWVNSFKPNPLKEGEQPTATLSIFPSNQDNSKVEQAPVYTAPP